MTCFISPSIAISPGSRNRTTTGWRSTSRAGHRAWIAAIAVSSSSSATKTSTSLRRSRLAEVADVPVQSHQYPTPDPGGSNDVDNRLQFHLLTFWTMKFPVPADDRGRCSSAAGVPDRTRRVADVMAPVDDVRPRQGTLGQNASRSFLGRKGQRRVARS